MYNSPWKMNRRQYFTDFVTIPLLIMIALFFVTFVSWEFVLGMLGWSLAEYLIHRFIFHKVYRKDHWMHHMDVEEYIGIQGWKIFLMYSVGYIVAYYLGIASFFIGFASGYLCYITMHFFMHRPKTLPYRFMTPLIKNHNLHHETGIEMNYGVTSPLWDYFFRTKV